MTFNEEINDLSDLFPFDIEFAIPRPAQAWPGERSKIENSICQSILILTYVHNVTSHIEVQRGYGGFNWNPFVYYAHVTLRIKP